MDSLGIGTQILFVVPDIRVPRAATYGQKDRLGSLHQYALVISELPPSELEAVPRRFNFNLSSRSRISYDFHPVVLVEPNSLLPTPGDQAYNWDSRPAELGRGPADHGEVRGCIFSENPGKRPHVDALVSVSR